MVKMRCPVNKAKLETIYRSMFGPTLEIAEFGKGYSPGENYAWEVPQPPVRLWIEDWEPIWKHTDFSGRDMRRCLGSFVGITANFKYFYDQDDAMTPFLATENGRKFFENMKLAWETYLKLVQLHVTSNTDSVVCRAAIETFEKATDIANVLSSHEYWRLEEIEAAEAGEWDPDEYEPSVTPEQQRDSARSWVDRNCRNVD